MKTQFHRRIVHTLVIALLSGGLLFGPALPVGAVSTILYVAPASGCSGTPNCYPTVQAALAVAQTGNEIRVAAGTYTDIHDCARNDVVTTGTVKAVVCVNKTMTIRGGYNNTFSVHDPSVNVTTLDAGGHGRVLYITGAISPTIADLSLTHGNATGLGGHSDAGSEYDAGSGVFIHTATVTLTNNHIFANTAASNGGGVYVGHSDSLLAGNTINANSAEISGGGVFLYKNPVSLTGNHIFSNTCNGNGAGVSLLYSDSLVSGNSISDNTATLDGGGLLAAASNPTLNGNVFSGNTANRGGGVYLWYSHSNLTNNVFLQNQVSSLGSGVYIGGSTPTLLQTTFNHNTGGDGSAVYATDDGQSTPTYSTVTMKNTIVAFQTIGIRTTTGSTVAVDGVLTYSNGANTSGTGITLAHTYSGNPLFLADGYHLGALSAAINKGVNAGVLFDIDGQHRIGTPDLGADEFSWSSYLPLMER